MASQFAYRGNQGSGSTITSMQPRHGVLQSLNPASGSLRQMIEHILCMRMLLPIFRTRCHQSVRGDSTITDHSFLFHQHKYSELLLGKEKNCCFSLYHAPKISNGQRGKKGKRMGLNGINYAEIKWQEYIYRFIP